MQMGLDSFFLPTIFSSLRRNNDKKNSVDNKSKKKNSLVQISSQLILELMLEIQTIKVFQNLSKPIVLGMIKQKRLQNMHKHKCNTYFTPTSPKLPIRV